MDPKTSPKNIVPQIKFYETYMYSNTPTIKNNP